ncbi:hypothetical protein [Burkholderia stabilis]|uniref:hypothetical protein n=1 Tax=Burkholderia stabilis TaxID=95485 RepID=UPI001F4A9776|nr:hypothetical protein [Burkholderia stabilis]HDR9586667.1 hypothetical protein [Burkholderia stabilis]HDR9650248.1 hypothetical protein [Burkholderia stabilis]HDR9680166.1 hypothetical protein [Burkholderia stabilis]
MITWPVKTRSVSAAAPEMVSTAGIAASGIVEAYFDSRQMMSVYSSHFVFRIFVMRCGARPLRRRIDFCQCVADSFVRGVYLRNLSDFDRVAFTLI